MLSRLIQFVAALAQVRSAQSPIVQHAFLVRTQASSKLRRFGHSFLCLCSDFRVFIHLLQKVGLQTTLAVLDAQPEFCAAKWIARVAHGDEQPIARANRNIVCELRSIIDRRKIQALVDAVCVAKADVVRAFLPVVLCSKHQKWIWCIVEQARICNVQTARCVGGLQHQFDVSETIRLADLRIVRKTVNFSLWQARFAGQRRKSTNAARLLPNRIGNGS